VQTSDLYESVTSSIIADFEKGAVPRTRPWKGGNSGGIMRAATRRYYTGINVLILWSARDEHGYPSPQWMTFTLADIRVGGDMAGYIPSRDYITLPPATAFKSMESYYATTLHELGHWSGHETRLKRELSTRFGSESYAAEELVAELTSAFLCAELGVQGKLRHSGYIDHWIKLLKSDPRAIFTAASKASQAANYLRSFSEARNEVPCLG
jgi:antirestriction protein ArdC